MKSTPTKFAMEAYRLTGYSAPGADLRGQINRDADPIGEAERIADLVERNTPEATLVYSEYCHMFERAINEGRIGDTDRIRALYPIIHEINQEIDEIEEEDRIMEPIYAAADRIVNAFADIIDLRDSIPPDFHAQICRLLVGWVGEIDFRLSGEDLKESLVPKLGEAVCDLMTGKVKAARQRSA